MLLPLFWIDKSINLDNRTHSLINQFLLANELLIVTPIEFMLIGGAFICITCILIILNLIKVSCKKILYFFYNYLIFALSSK